MTDPNLGTWAGMPIAAWTRNFLFVYNAGDDDALTAALYVAATCEDDLDWLESIFQCNFESIEYATVVWVGRGGGAASNGGWDPSESAGMYINCAYNPAGQRTATAETVRMLFVAELAELLMDFTPHGWDRGSAYGEALSVVCATLRHPVGYYRSGAGPRVRAWLDSNPRPDWVAQGGGDDQNQTLYGAGILYLYYLLSQRRFALSQIVVAGGWNAPDTFNKLTGQPVGQAGAEFNALLARVPWDARHAGQPVSALAAWPARGSHRRHGHPVSDFREAAELSIKLTAGVLCKPAVYTYHRHDLTTEIEATAKAVGFGTAGFRWSINGMLDVHNQSIATPTRLPITFSDDTPDRHRPPFDQVVPVQYLISDGWSASSLPPAQRRDAREWRGGDHSRGARARPRGGSETTGDASYPFVTRPTRCRASGTRMSTAAVRTPSSCWPRRSPPWPTRSSSSSTPRTRT